MKFLAKTVVTLLLLVSFQTTTAQAKNEEKLSLNSGTIDNQFEYVIRKSGKYKDYKIVKRTWLYTIKANTLDSLNTLRKELLNIQNIISTQTNEISTLKHNLTNTKASLTKIIEEKDSISFFGTPMRKSSYNVLLWGIISVLIALLLFFIYKFKNSNVITKNSKLRLQDVEQEYEDYRRIALEREQKVRRQLQDEINKNKA